MRVLPQVLKLVPVAVVASVITKDKKVNNNVHRVRCPGNDVRVSPKVGHWLDSHPQQKGKDVARVSHIVHESAPFVGM